MAKKTQRTNPQTVYHYCGAGVCIPGLPHEVTMAQADALGLLNLLEAAIERGDYQSQEPPTPETEQEA